MNDRVAVDPAAMGLAGRSTPPTLESLGRELGVSRQTVSNVLNAPERVKAETRERVLAAIEQSGYRPSAWGRALRTRRSMCLALRIHPHADDINGTVMDRFLHALTAAAQRNGYRITLLTASDDHDELGLLSELHAAQAIDGCVLTNTTLDDPRPSRLRALGVPVVAFGRPWGSLPGDHAWIDVDGAAGTRAATEHLLAAGHRRIGFLGWKAGSGTGDDRRRGWHEAMEGAAADLVAGIDDDVQAAVGAARRLRDAGATAVVCVSDSLALGALSVFSSGRGVAPVVGFDDTPVARALGLSSVAQPVEEAARFCLETLVDASQSGATPQIRQHLLTPTVVVRSVGGR